LYQHYNSCLLKPLIIFGRMKKFLTQFTLLITIVVLLASCKKDDDSSVSLVGKWYQIRETRQATVDNIPIESLTITNFNNVNYMNFKQNGTVEVYSPKGISLNVSGSNSTLIERTDNYSEMEEYSYKVSSSYLTLTQSSHSVKATIKSMSESSLVFQVEHSFKNSGKSYVSNTEVEYKKQ
jgi:hypothetical protein